MHVKEKKGPQKEFVYNQNIDFNDLNYPILNELFFFCLQKSLKLHLKFKNT